MVYEVQTIIRLMIETWTTVRSYSFVGTTVRSYSFFIALTVSSDSCLWSTDSWSSDSCPLWQLSPLTVVSSDSCLHWQLISDSCLLTLSTYQTKYFLKADDTHYAQTPSHENLTIWKLLVIAFGKYMLYTCTYTWYNVGRPYLYIVYVQIWA